MSEIKEFWKNKHQYQGQQLKDKIVEFYRADFIENYTKWKKNVDQFNEEGLAELKAVHFPEKFWTPIQYDAFCQTFIDMVLEWIEVNKDIKSDDVKVIYEKFFTEFLGKHLEVWQQNMYTMDSLMESIVKMVPGYIDAKQ
jgi:hypothetical protein